MKSIYPSIARFLSFLISVLVLMSCVMETKYQPQNILFLGNSITLRVADSTLDWYQPQGMAATALEKDYVHQTMQILKQNGLELTLQLGSRDCDPEVCGDVIAEHLQNINEVHHLHPRFVIVQLGENSSDADVTSGKLFRQYRSLIEAIRSRTDAPVFCLTEWDEPSLTDPRNSSILKAISPYPEIKLVDITSLARKPENYGDSLLFSNRAVAWHPGDLGMQHIAKKLSLAILASK